MGQDKIKRWGSANYNDGGCITWSMPKIDLSWQNKQERYKLLDGAGQDFYACEVKFPKWTNQTNATGRGRIRLLNLANR